MNGSIEMSDAPRHPADPLAEVAIDATHAGFRTLENVTQAVTESLRIRASDRYVRRRRVRHHSTQRSGTQRLTTRRGTDAPGQTVIPERPEPGEVTEHLMRIFADLLDRAGEVAQQIAEGIAPEGDGEPDDGPDDGPDDEQPARVERIDVEAPAGAVATASFTVYNTGSTVLRRVRFETSGLHGRGGRIDPEAIRFAPEVIDAIPPGEGVTVSVSVAAKDERSAAAYHGLVLTEPGEGAAMLTVRWIPAR